MHSSDIKEGDILNLEGQLVESPAAGQTVEFVTHKLEKLSERHESYPLANTHKMPLDSIRKYPHLQTRTDYFQVIILALFGCYFPMRDL